MASHGSRTASQKAAWVTSPSSCLIQEERETACANVSDVVRNHTPYRAYPQWRISTGLASRVRAGSLSLRPAPSVLPDLASAVRGLPPAIPGRSETPIAADDQRATLSTAAVARDSSGRERGELAQARTSVERPSTDHSSSGRRTTRRRRSPSTGGRRR